MHLDASARATSPVEDRLARKFASSFHADEVELSRSSTLREGGYEYRLNKRVVNNFAPVHYT